MATYQFRGADNKEYGPVSAEVLRGWIAQGRANSTSSVRAEGDSEWKPLSSFPELADALVGEPPPSPCPTPPAAGPVRTSRLAIASLVCGVFGLLCLPALAGVVLGIVALMKINKSGGQLRGTGLAVAGLCVSGIMLLLIGPAMLLPAMASAKSKATRINCVNNLKQIGLAARLYSLDNKDIFPLDFLSMSNELNTPKILFCAADRKHRPASNWAEFDPVKNLSYEYRKPGMTESNALNSPDEVVFRCPIHNNVGLGDGTVQQRR